MHFILLPKDYNGKSKLSSKFLQLSMKYIFLLYTLWNTEFKGNSTSYDASLVSFKKKKYMNCLDTYLLGETYMTVSVIVIFVL